MQIIKDGKHSHYLDGKKPSESNWMRFVNCARSEDEQSVTAFQYQGNIYFRAHRHIFAGNEMLVRTFLFGMMAWNTRSVSLVVVAGSYFILAKHWSLRELVTKYKKGSLSVC